jgi:hypothetical protein
MIKTLMMSVLLAGVLQTPMDTFKKEMKPLQDSVDGLVTESRGTIMSESKASWIEGYGVVVSVEVALEPPRNALFPSAGAPSSRNEAEARATARQKDIKDKVTAFLKQRVGAMQSLGAEDSLAIAVHLMNTNPAFTPNLPHQLVFSVSKASPQTVVYKEL